MSALPETSRQRIKTRWVRLPPPHRALTRLQRATKLPGSNFGAFILVTRLPPATDNDCSRRNSYPGCNDRCTPPTPTTNSPTRGRQPTACQPREFFARVCTWCPASLTPHSTSPASTPGRSAFMGVAPPCLASLPTAQDGPTRSRQSCSTDAFPSRVATAPTADAAQLPLPELRRTAYRIDRKSSCELRDLPGLVRHRQRTAGKAHCR